MPQARRKKGIDPVPDRRIRQRRTALRHGRRGAARPRFPAGRRAASISSPARRARARPRCSNCSISRSAPTRGRIRLFGEELADVPRAGLPALRRRIGVVFQDFRLIRHLSVFDNVALPLRIAGTDEAEVEAHGPRDARLGRAWPSARPRARRRCRAGSSSASRSPARSSPGPTCSSPTSRPAMSMPTWRRACCICSAALNRLGTTVVVATHDVGLIQATPGAQLIRLESGTLADPDRRAAQPAAPRERAHDRLAAARRRPSGDILGGAPLALDHAVDRRGDELHHPAGRRLRTGHRARRGRRSSASIGSRYALTVPAGGGDVGAIARAAASACPACARSSRSASTEMRAHARALARARRRQPRPAGAGADRLRPCARAPTSPRLEPAIARLAPGAPLTSYERQRRAAARPRCGCCNGSRSRSSLLLAAAASAAVVLAARGAIDSHRSTVEVLHGIGATDAPDHPPVPAPDRLRHLGRQPRRGARRRARDPALSPAARAGPADMGGSAPRHERPAAARRACRLLLTAARHARGARRDPVRACGAIL